MKPCRIAAQARVAVLLLLVAGPAWAADDPVSFKKRSEEEKRFVESVGDAIVKAAHPTGRKRSLVKYEITMPKPNRTELAIKMEYHGLVTNKTYVADITVKVDSTNPKEWEVINIDYADNNNISANLKKVQELVKEFNK
jgi:hypothetical protein